MPIKSNYRVVLADDHAMFRQDLNRILMSGSDLDVVGEARDGTQLIEILSLIDPAADMAIVDITLRDIGGIKAAATIKHFYPAIKVLIISTHREIQYVQEALSSGADGYLLKEYLDAELFPAIEHIRQNGVYLSNLLNENAMTCFTQCKSTIV